MEAAFSELPLALFTTLAPAGAGAFIALAVAVMTAKIEDDALRKLDRTVSYTHLTLPTTERV